MALIARASKTVRNKNALIILMCAVFLGWFAYDGYITYPQGNDRFVAKMRDEGIKDGRVDEKFLSDLKAWTTWQNESAASRQNMDNIVKSSQNRMDVSVWKSPFDITLQREIVYGLVVVIAAAIWWFVHCQKRRAIAEDTTVSPAQGLIVPWDKITLVDNTRWKSSGIVEITFPGPDGKPRKAKFDDYELEREPLLDILDLLAQNAVNAEFIPKEEPDTDSPPNPSTPGNEPAKA
jgi:hypothetical protein